MASSVPQQTLPARPQRYVTLDLWRCFACLAVVAFHATAISYESHRTNDPFGLLVALTARGWMGVPIFFVISGYGISAAIEAAKGKKGSGREYFARRSSRIYPPFWACLALTFLFAGTLRMLGAGHVITGYFGPIPMVPDFWQITPRQWIGNLALIEMWRHNIDGVPGALVLGHTWTLCYEVQFYAAAGLLLILTPGRFFPAAAAVSLAVLACGPLGLDARGMMWDGRWMLFAAGIGVYYAIHRAGPRAKKLITAGLILGVFYGFLRRVDMLPPAIEFASLNRSEALAAFIFALIILALHQYDNHIKHMRVMRPFFYLGKMSYSIFLVHLPIVFAIAHSLFLAGLTTPAPTALITLPLCMAASITGGWLFYIAIERRFEGYPRKATPPDEDKKLAAEPQVEIQTEKDQAPM